VRLLRIRRARRRGLPARTPGRAVSDRHPEGPACFERVAFCSNRRGDRRMSALHHRCPCPGQRLPRGRTGRPCRGHGFPRSHGPSGNRSGNVVNKSLPSTRVPVEPRTLGGQEPAVCLCRGHQWRATRIDWQKFL
jgi:hypothetical protein